MSSPPRLLVLGNNGQVGWELQRTLAPLGEVIALGRQSSPAADLTDLAGLDHLVESLRPTWIINAAAHTAVDRAESEAELAMQINGDAPRQLAASAKKIGAGLIHYSTDYVFDGTATHPYREEDATQPLGVYGQTKRAGEEAITAIAPHHLILRTSWVYGTRGRNFLLTIQRLAQEREELKIVADQIGAPTWSRHIAEATALLIARIGTPAALETKSGIYHLTNSGRTSWYGFAEAIIAASRPPLRLKRLLPITTADYPTPAKRPAMSLLDNQRLAATFGFTLPSWQSALQQAMDGD
jgi:dTDP-4-dehydrorhamnose reductase